MYLRERDVGIICVIIYDDLALEAWTQREREKQREREGKREGRERESVCVCGRGLSMQAAIDNTKLIPSSVPSTRLRQIK